MHTPDVGLLLVSESARYRKLHMIHFSALLEDATYVILPAFRNSEFRVADEGLSMARYYFDVRDCDGFHRDEIGDEFAAFDEARDQAQALLPDIAREELPDGELHVIMCDVRDERGRVVYRGKLTFEGTYDPA